MNFTFGTKTLLKISFNNTENAVLRRHHIADDEFVSVRCGGKSTGIALKELHNFKQIEHWYCGE
jgi:hypothetical protein